jgi:hypothetical protein
MTNTTPKLVPPAYPSCACAHPNCAGTYPSCTGAYPRRAAVTLAVLSVLPLFIASAVASINAAVLPSSRSITLGETATVFASVANGTSTLLRNCRISVNNAPGDFSFQRTDPVTNRPTGLRNHPVFLAPNGVESFVLALTPSERFSRPVSFNFTCTGVSAPLIPGVNTLQLRVSETPSADVVALARTADNDGILKLPLDTLSGAFAVAAVNVGTGATLNVTAQADAGMPIALSVCQTTPTGACLGTAAATITAHIAAGATPTFSIFASALSHVALDAAAGRIYVRFEDDDGEVHGATSIAAQTLEVESNLLFLDKPGMRAKSRPYRANTPHRDSLVRCAVAVREQASCSLGDLPLIGMETSDPDIDDIMNRVIVSHDWMGRNFEIALQRMGPEMRLLTRAATAIVISHDIRPSFYWAITGAIYLDPASIWLTAAERLDVDTAPDYRAEFGHALQFDFLSFPIKDGEILRRNNIAPRTSSHIEIGLVGLLFHELAHANDFFPVATHSAVNTSGPLWHNITLPSSNQLQSAHPLQSTLLEALAEVRYGGATATSTQEAVSPSEIGVEFPRHGATHWYSFYTLREDFAMLFEDLMLLYTYNIERDVAVTNKPLLFACGNLQVAWGQRNRVLDSHVLPRARFVARHVLPEATDALDQYLAAGMRAPVPMTPGRDFCGNLSAPDSGQDPTSRTARRKPVVLPRDIPYL